jgi:hypothetical protein
VHGSSAEAIARESLYAVATSPVPSNDFSAGGVVEAMHDQLTIALTREESPAVDASIAASPFDRLIGYGSRLMGPALLLLGYAACAYYFF